MSSKRNPRGWRFEAGQRVTAYPYTKDAYHAVIIWTDNQFAILAERQDAAQRRVRTVDLSHGWVGESTP